MGIIFFTIGLPGSGKTTVARKMQETIPSLVRINKDDIRAMLFTQPYKFSRTNEQMVVEIERKIVDTILCSGNDVIIDNTHLSPKHLNYYKDYIKYTHEEDGFLIGKNHSIRVIDLTSVPIDECIARDAKRDRPVGKGVIYRMARQANLVTTGNTKFTCDTDYIVCDLDGTLADCSHRLHYVRNINNDPNWKKNWGTFFDRMQHDGLREDVYNIALSYDLPIVIVSARPEQYRYTIIQWLDDHGIKYDHLLLRDHGDHRQDTIVKQEILDNYLDKNRIKAWIDDRPSVIRQIKSNGIQVIDVGCGVEF